MWKEDFNDIFDWIAFACMILLTIICCGGASYLAFYKFPKLLEITTVILCIILGTIIIVIPIAWIDSLLEDYK